MPIPTSVFRAVVALGYGDETTYEGSVAISERVVLPKWTSYSPRCRESNGRKTSVLEKG